MILIREQLLTVAEARELTRLGFEVDFVAFRMGSKDLYKVLVK